MVLFKCSNATDKAIVKNKLIEVRDNLQTSGIAVINIENMTRFVPDIPPAMQTIIEQFIGGAGFTIDVNSLSAVDKNSLITSLNSFISTWDLNGDGVGSDLTITKLSQLFTLMKKGV